MKTFTARDLGRKRGEIRQAIKDGGCIVQYKHSDRTLEMECVIVPMDEYRKLYQCFDREQKGYITVYATDEELYQNVNDMSPEKFAEIWLYRDRVKPIDDILKE